LVTVCVTTFDPARTAERVIVRKVRWKMPLQGFFGLRLVMNSNVSPLKNFKLFNAEQKQGLGAGTLGDWCTARREFKPLERGDRVARRRLPSIARERETRRASLKVRRAGTHDASGSAICSVR